MDTERQSRNQSRQRSCYRERLSDREWTLMNANKRNWSLVGLLGLASITEGPEQQVQPSRENCSRTMRKGQRLRGKKSSAAFASIGVHSRWTPLRCRGSGLPTLDQLTKMAA